MKKRKKTWVRFRHKVVLKLLTYPIKALFFLLYHLRTQRFTGWKDSRPCLILGNHTTPLDPVCLGTSFHFPIYYVASDHVLRQGWVSSLLRYLVAPIPIVKSKLDLQTIKDMLTVIGEGGSVNIFPEGNRNYNGETAPFSPAVAKLARQLKVPLVLYRFEGGYFTAPRWADSIRRGRMRGHVVRVVSVEEMQGMTSAQLYEIIKSELHENAYLRQEQSPVRYRGQHLAEALERVLYLCPACGGMATLKSANDIVSCGCGLRARYTELGSLEPEGCKALPFGTLLEWDRWQKMTLPGWLLERMNGADGSAPLACDGEQKLYECKRAGANTLLAEGRFSLYTDRFRFEGAGQTVEYPLESISKVAIQGKQSLQFTASQGVTYEVKSQHPRSALKYLNLFELLRSENREVPNGFFSL